MNILRQPTGIHKLVCGLFMFLFSTTASAQKYVGGDISMLPAYEKAGATYYTHDGEPINDLITYSKGRGLERHARTPLRQPDEADDEQQRSLYMEQ